MLKGSYAGLLDQNRGFLFYNGELFHEGINNILPSALPKAAIWQIETATWQCSEDFFRCSRKHFTFTRQNTNPCLVTLKTLFNILVGVIHYALSSHFLFDRRTKAPICISPLLPINIERYGNLIKSGFYQKNSRRCRLTRSTSYLSENHKKPLVNSKQGDWHIFQNWLEVFPPLTLRRSGPKCKTQWNNSWLTYEWVESRSYIFAFMFLDARRRH